MDASTATTPLQWIVLLVGGGICLFLGYIVASWLTPISEVRPGYRVKRIKSNTWGCATFIFLVIFVAIIISIWG